MGLGKAVLRPAVWTQALGSALCGVLRHQGARFAGWPMPDPPDRESVWGASFGVAWGGLRCAAAAHLYTEVGPAPLLGYRPLSCKTAESPF